MGGTVTTSMLIWRGHHDEYPPTVAKVDVVDVGTVVLQRLRGVLVDVAWRCAISTNPKKKVAHLCNDTKHTL